VAEETEVLEQAEAPEPEETVTEQTEKMVAEDPASAEAVDEEAAEASPPASVAVAEETTASEAAEAPEIVEEIGEFETGDLYYYGTGRRKTASAQVRLYPSKESDFTVNERPVDQYFSRRTDLQQITEPLRMTATENMFRITVKVQGGGISGQAGAVRHGISRALVKANPELRPSLRKGGFLTRDSRVKERKKPGLKRARKAPQYTKR
jgi:small subunit ribosomal protein S9